MLSLFRYFNNESSATLFQECEWFCWVLSLPNDDRYALQTAGGQRCCSGMGGRVVRNGGKTSGQADLLQRCTAVILAGFARCKLTDAIYDQSLSDAWNLFIGKKINVGWRMMHIVSDIIVGFEQLCSVMKLTNASHLQLINRGNRLYNNGCLSADL